MKHLSIVEHGQFLGLASERLAIWREKELIGEYPLNRLKTISIARKGVSLSSDLVLACAARGIKLFFLDFRGQAVAGLTGMHQHAVAEVRRAQFAFVNSVGAIDLCRRLIAGKIRNQRAVLLYFAKYKGRQASEGDNLLNETAALLARLARQTQDTRLPAAEDAWRAMLLGFEGHAAAAYWRALREAGLLPGSFEARIGRGAGDIVNQSLNYGYAILASMVWHCLVNAGLEIYAGVLHTGRPGKPSLVLDIMEELRPWMVDRVVIKLRPHLEQNVKLDASLKRRIVDEVHGTFVRRYHYHGRQHTLESILQRQAYRLAGQFMGATKYRPYRFRW